MIEAMAMELPTIATNWSGNTQFMSNENSYLIPVEKMVPASSEGHQWAQPSLSALKTAMRRVFENRQEAKSFGKRARREMVQQYSKEVVARGVVEKLQSIEKNLPQLLKLKDQKKEEAKLRKEREHEAKQNKIQIKIIEDQ